MTNNMTREEAIEVYSGLLNKKIKEAFEFFVPELAESEDERIRKEIIEYLQRYLPTDELLKEQEMVAWLEKQKELPLMNGDSDAYFDEWNLQQQNPTKRQCFEEGIRYAQRLQKEQKTTENPFDANETMKMKDRIDEGFTKMMMQEQKPAENISRLTVQGKGIYKICPHCKSRMIRDDSKVYTSLPPQYGYNCPKCGAMEFDTVIYDNPEMEEWGEFDKGVLKDAICATDILGNDESFNKGNPNLGKAFRVAKDWLKSLPERLVLQSKQEWSEEDEEMIQDIIASIDTNIAASDFHEMENWLKSLRPSWKPSEEQMEALLWCTAHLGGADHRVLAELYEHLKKLK